METAVTYPTQEEIRAAARDLRPGDILRIERMVYALGYSLERALKIHGIVPDRKTA